MVMPVVVSIRSYIPNRRNSFYIAQLDLIFASLAISQLSWLVKAGV